MHIFMRQQAGGELAGSVIDQTALIDPAVVRFVVLETKMRDVIAERVKEVVIAIMVRAEKLLRLR